MALASDDLVTAATHDGWVSVSVRRSSVLLISVYVDPESGSHWYARLLTNETAACARGTSEYLTTIDAVSQKVRTWLESVTNATGE